jgi:hypothetical protein
MRAAAVMTAMLAPSACAQILGLDDPRTRDAAAVDGVVGDVATGHDAHGGRDGSATPDATARHDGNMPIDARHDVRKNNDAGDTGPLDGGGDGHDGAREAASDSGGDSANDGPSEGGPCTPGETLCDSQCVNTYSNASNCGGCGLVCPASNGTCSGSRCLQKLYTSPTPITQAGSNIQVAVDDSSVYWNSEVAVGGLGTILKVAMAGGTPTTLATVSSGGGSVFPFALVSGTVYALDDGLRTLIAVAPGGTTTTVANFAQTDLDGPHDLVTDGTTLYWPGYTAGSDTNLMSWPISGGTPIALLPESLGTSIFPSDVATGAAMVFFGSNGTSDLYSAPSGGTSNPSPLAMDDSADTPVAANATYVVYESTSGFLNRVPVGGGVAAVPIAPVGGLSVYDMVVDNTSVYWTVYAGAVYKAPLDGVPDGGSPTVLSPDTTAMAITVDDMSVYWFDGASVLKLTPK